MRFDDLALPGLLQVALLHGGERVVDDDHVGLDGVGLRLQRLDFALSEQRRRRRGAERRDLGVDHLEVERLGEADRLLQPLLRRAQGAGVAACGVDDERPLRPAA